MHIALPFLLPGLLLATTTGVMQWPSREAHRLSRSRPGAKRSPDVYTRAGCESADPTNNVTQRLNQLLSSGGTGYTLSLCPNQNYPITAPLQFTAANQEISTQGLPTDSSRAMLTISGPTMQSTQPNHTTAVVGQCSACNGVKLRHVQINGTRLGAPSIGGGANIEMGGATTGQLVEYVRSFDPRSWSCLHLSEGPGLKCSNAIIQNNDIGPCGSDAYRQWADGISVACAGTTVRNNLINTPTDGGIVIFGSPGTLVENNTIWVETHTLLGGINLVDYDPWSGNYDGTIVRQNNIIGGLATSSPTSLQATEGTNNADAIIKVGIAMGPRVWFGNHFEGNVSHGGMVLDNKFEGAFGYAMGINSARNFTVQNNVVVGNTSFIGSRGPNCSSADTTPTSQPFVAQENNITDSALQSDFVNIQDADHLTCIMPPPGGSYWPFGGSHDPNSPPDVANSSSTTTGLSSAHGGISTGEKVGIAIGVVVGILLVAVLAWFIRRRRATAQRERIRQTAWESTNTGYTNPVEY
ncbi:hypothetical protein JB92DRAFT_2803962 [Gautieria morchelliformis]|nr:hypothetical protein JB92DRAFT_2803962 [Gautieria morchelliformis]